MALRARWAKDTYACDNDQEIDMSGLSTTGSRENTITARAHNQLTKRERVWRMADGHTKRKRSE
jgi:hypothetical protein